MIPQVYGAATDELEDVTQKWCDDAQIAMNKLAKAKNVIQSIASLHIKRDVEIIDEIAEILHKHNKYKGW